MRLVLVLALLVAVNGFRYRRNFGRTKNQRKYTVDSYCYKSECSQGDSSWCLNGRQERCKRGEICMTQVEADDGELEIKKSCKKKHSCLRRKGRNADYCKDGYVKNSRKCTFCCTGTRCNNEMFDKFQVVIDIGQWSSWSQCNKPCGSGTQHRKRSVTTLLEDPVRRKRDAFDTDEDDDDDDDDFRFPSSSSRMQHYRHGYGHGNSKWWIGPDVDEDFEVTEQSDTKPCNTFQCPTTQAPTMTTMIHKETTRNIFKIVTQVPKLTPPNTSSPQKNTKKGFKVMTQDPKITTPNNIPETTQTPRNIFKIVTEIPKMATSDQVRTSNGNASATEQTSMANATTAGLNITMNSDEELVGISFATEEVPEEPTTTSTAGKSATESYKETTEKGLSPKEGEPTTKPPPPKVEVAPPLPRFHVVPKKKPEEVLILP